MYSLLKPILFKFDPEKVHHAVTDGLRLLNNIPGGAGISKAVWLIEDVRLEREVFGLKFKNPVGLAAGFDKNGLMVKEMANLGFGFVETGTVTPLPQGGNPTPRMFRLPKDEALINRMGFNNDGVDVVAERIKAYRASADHAKQRVIIGGNIGKNKVTPNEDAVSDYVKCFDKLFDVVDYFVVNVSSPNTPGLRALQEKEPLLNILNTLQQRNIKNGVSRPILLKIAPDLTDEQLDDIVEIVQESHIAGVIATNTTISRTGLQTLGDAKEEVGGLSGKPLTQRSTEVIAYLHQKSKGSFPIIGVGGIHSEQDALDKITAGASLVQLYTGFIYEGPGLIGRINKALLK
ncbi:quinone-dependent dihydroorotate dehydrogenase [Mucilaginibacter myungsuensis]|uniref:Dihydroorotate dehydrogenase (quinone) n=1 Tax=Mucilaginibacter myungsuensis TaxID=649104 RepID=A0A929L2H1_9SPHI|nr:quinone-dependent dihydroorotate dehydrogenase [Mucilaginibacter myungsuensis]MBE9662880.1 quinone-dependent dihydroorotate dehydrogenase [Mucilaginibacter myungsuensis]MDN3598300.1 quinone-dependent dihydroorotate dehydrogenase [Mucilaginibacter myungsuensis]